MQFRAKHSNIDFITAMIQGDLMKLPSDDMKPYADFRSDKERRRALTTLTRWKYGSWVVCFVVAAVAALRLSGQH